MLGILKFGIRTQLACHCDLAGGFGLEARTVLISVHSGRSVVMLVSRGPFWVLE